MSQEVKAKASGKILGRKELFALGIGQVIGAGVVTVLGSAIAVSGTSAWLAYGVAIVVGFVTILPFVFLSSVAGLRGGMYSLVGGLAGKTWAGIYLMCYIPNAFSLSLFGVALGQYTKSLLPFLNERMVGVLLTTLFFIINLMGIKGMAKAQKIMTWLLIGTLLMFIVFGMFQLQSSPFDWSSPDFLLGGGTGFLEAVILLVYSTTSYYMVINFGGAAKRPKKDIPLVMLVTPLILFVVYCGAGIVATCVLPIAEVAGQPLTFVAKQVLPAPLFILFIVGGVMMALTSTLNSQFGAFGRIYSQGCKDGWFPGVLAKQNKNDQASVLLTLSWIIAIVPIITGFNVKDITNNIVLLTYISGLIPMFAVLTLPKKYPDQWKKSRLHIPDGLFYALMIFSIIVKLAVTYLSASALTTTALVVSLVAIALCFGYGFFRAKSPSVRMDISAFDFSDDME